MIVSGCLMAPRGCCVVVGFDCYMIVFGCCICVMVFGCCVIVFGCCKSGFGCYMITLGCCRMSLRPQMLRCMRWRRGWRSALWRCELMSAWPVRSASSRLSVRPCIPPSCSWTTYRSASTAAYKVSQLHTSMNQFRMSYVFSCPP